MKQVRVVTRVVTNPNPVVVTRVIKVGVWEEKNA